MKPIGVIFNPFAYLNKKQTQRRIDALEKTLGEAASVCCTKNKDEIPVVLKEFHRQGIKLLCISGGDGTFNSVLSSYIDLFGDNNLPVIVPLKGGTMNMVVGDAGLEGNQNDVCHNLVWYVKNKQQVPTIERGLIRVTDLRFNNHQYAFTWIDGFLYRFIRWYYKEGGGVGVALKLILKSGIMSLINLNHDLFKEVESRVYINDRKLPFESHLFIATASVKRLVFGFRVFTEEVVPAERFGVLYMRLPYFRKALYRLPKVLYAGLKSSGSGDFLNQATKTVTIEGNRGYVIDGEVYDSDEPNDIRLEAGPKVQILSFKGERIRSDLFK